MPAPRRRLAFTPWLAALACTAACVNDRGEVEVNWTIVDRGGTQVFPSGQLGSTCDFTGVLPGATDPVRYGLQTQLRLCEPGCAAGCGDPACQIEDLRFDCGAARGYATVPARPDDPYDFHVSLLATPESGACSCFLIPPCILAPGPRSRTVEPGLITDLQVYLFVLGLDDILASTADGRTRLDLATCCLPDPSCTAP